MDRHNAKIAVMGDEEEDKFQTAGSFNDETRFLNSTKKICMMVAMTEGLKKKIDSVQFHRVFSMSLLNEMTVEVFKVEFLMGKFSGIRDLSRFD